MSASDPLITVAQARAAARAGAGGSPGATGPIHYAGDLIVVLDDPQAGDLLQRGVDGLWKNTPSATFTGAGVHRGAWAATTAYKANDLVIQGGNTYSAKVAFTSGSSFNAANWNPVANVNVASDNTFAGNQTFAGISTFQRTETDAANNRPVQTTMNFQAAPASAPAAAVDYHGIDLLMRGTGGNNNNQVGLYPLESNAQLEGSASALRLVSVYGFSNNLGTGNVTGDMTSFQALQRNRGTGTVALMRSVRARTPVNDGGGLVTNVKGIHIEDQRGAAADANTYALYSEGGQSAHFGYFGFGTLATAPAAQVDIKPGSIGDRAFRIIAKSGTTVPIFDIREPNDTQSYLAVAADGGVTIRNSLLPSTNYQLQVRGPTQNTAMQVTDGTNGIAMTIDSLGTKIITSSPTTPIRIVQSGTSRLSWDSTGNMTFTPANKPTLPAAATDAATTQTLVNAIRAALVTYGLA